jgi:hypothetical protein
MLIFVGLYVLGKQNQMQSNLLFKLVFWTIQELMLRIFFTATFGVPNFNRK